MKNLIINSNVKYNDLMSQLSVKPSLSKQIQIFIHTRSEGTTTEKRFAAAIQYALQNKKIKFARVVEMIKGRYKNNLNAHEKFISPYWLAQIFQKLLKNAVDSNIDDVQLLALYAKYNRAVVFSKLKDEKGAKVQLADGTKDDADEIKAVSFDDIQAAINENENENAKK